MDQKKFEAILTLLVPAIIKNITANYDWDEIKATKKFYESKVYALLEEEDTKMWHLSPMMLFSLFDDEMKTGTFTTPEEA